ncbi:hypothetical protein FOT62_22770 [Serratia marcescens]|uniref:Mu-like prophage I protein n=2 Tax=Serratia TaxID=613 RepID=A0A5C7BXA8_SERMA|nr:hypothetical protein FOT62_22770 [Serratia marcescens]TXE55337.1 hypothetical protein FOT56_25395 [Serratia marcescens]
MEITEAAPRVQLFPAGRFRAAEGATDVPYWYLDASLAQRLIAAANVRTNDYVFDYEHQTLNAIKNGQPAPAAGWFKKLEWVEGQGLFAIDVKWTDKAKAMIEAREYRYVSPMFRYDAAGNVRRILNAAITNLPALDGMAELTAAASLLLSSEDNAMDEEILAALCALFGLPGAATESDLKFKLTELQDKTLKPAACSSLSDLLAQKDNKIAALSTQAPDPAKFVPISTVESLQQTVAALSAKITGDEVEGLVTAALSDGRLLNDMADWARDLGNKDVAALKGYLDKARPIAALSGLQTGGKPPLDAEGRAVMDDNALAICSMFGTDTKDIASQLAQEEQ